MDSLITAAARALATGDPLGALKRVALRDDAPALALRGIAMAQLGDLVRAKALLRSAVRAFGPNGIVRRLPWCAPTTIESQPASSVRVFSPFTSWLAWLAGTPNHRWGPTLTYRQSEKKAKSRRSQRR